MQILISCAKTMDVGDNALLRSTIPRFEAKAEEAVRQLQQIDASELATALGTTPKIAAGNAARFAKFFDEDAPLTPALLAYTGIVFKQIDPSSFTKEDFDYASRHLFITSFLYGLLRPGDAIRPYRLEGRVRLPWPDGPSRFDYWKPLLTDYLVQEVKADDGILVNLASAEMKRLFDWKRVERELTVLTPEFKTISGGRERSIVIYTKMARGLAVRHLVKSAASNPDNLYFFEPDVPGAAVVMEVVSNK